MPRYRLTTEKTWDQTLDDLVDTFRKWPGITHWTVDPLRPKRAINQYHNEQERRVTLRYTLAGREIVLTMDRQARAHDNLRVLYLAVEAMRLNEQRGIAEVVASAYAQLPGPKDLTPRSAPAIVDPYAALGVDRSYPLDVIESIWKARLRAEHPDRGGSQENAAKLNAAMDAIRKEHGK
jgi:hypothetical protein